MLNRTHTRNILATLVLSGMVVACSDNDDPADTTPPKGDESGGQQTPVDTPDAPPAVASFAVLADNATPSANAINGIAHASNGKVYAVGYRAPADDEDADRQTVVLAYNADGSPDTSFGDNGAMTLNVKTQGDTEGDSGGEYAYGVVVTGAGDLLVVVNASDGNGTDTLRESRSVYLLRLDSNDNFAVDANFGDDGGANGLIAGAQEVVFGWPNSANDAFPSATAETFPSDFAYDMDLDTTGDVERVVINGFGTAASGQMDGDSQATDRDRYITRLLVSDGTVDPQFNGGRAFTQSTPRGENSRDNGRRAIVEADGSIMSGGYTNLGDGQGNHCVLIRLLPNGTADSNFGNFVRPAEGSVPGAAEPGSAVFNPFRDSGGFAECYSVDRQSSGDYVTTGYGRANGGTAPASGPLSSYENTEDPDLVTFRVTNGSDVDSTYGNPAEPGTQAIQSEGVDAADAEEQGTQERGRDLVVLNDDRIVQVGYYGSVPALYVFTADGVLDTSVDDDGLILLPHTASAGTEPVTQQFFTAELSDDGSRLAVGTRGNDPVGARVVLINTKD